MKEKYNALKAIIAFLILLLGFRILTIFYEKQDDILQGNFQFFMILVIAGMALLIYLLFLVSNSGPKVAKSTKKIKKGKKR